MRMGGRGQILLEIWLFFSEIGTKALLFIVKKRGNKGQLLCQHPAQVAMLLVVYIDLADIFEWKLLFIIAAQRSFELRQF